MRSTTLTTHTALLSLLLFVPALQAQQQVMVDIAPCMALNNNADKLACYNRLEASARASQPNTNAAAPAAPPATAAAPPAARALPVVPTTVPTPPAATPETQTSSTQTPAPASNDDAVATFGNSAPASARVLTSTDGKQELHDRITDLQEREPGRYLITLASGQVWYQSNSQRFRLRKGMDVRIYPSPLGGSYRMARDDGEETGFVQVERLK